MFHGKTTPEGDEELRRGGSLTQGSNLYQTGQMTHPLRIVEATTCQGLTI